MMAKRCFIFLCLTVCAACNVLPDDSQHAGFMLMTGWRFYPPCGEPRLSAKLPEQSGYYLVYVLRDSLQVKDCVSPPENDPMEMDYERDFLLAAVVRDAQPGWHFRLKDMKIADSILYVRLNVSRSPVWLSASYVWKVNGAAVKLIRLYTDADNYAYVHGPAWNEAPVKWRHLPEER